jgi:hypothetical protein
MNSNDVVRNSSLSANEKLALAVHGDSPARVKAALVSSPLKKGPLLYI